MLSLNKFLKSLKCAFRGLIHALRSEQSFRLQLIVAFIVIALAVYFRIPAIKALILGLTILMVLSFELVNTMAERIIDLVEPRWQDKIRDIKDVLAAAVLIAALGSIIIGLIIFWPYL
ncbi:MAG: diacylglycerol kinase [Candidatus Portnoybacteria bacterium CG23_combo_of_CG06-09_8_20_14_all_37_13]|uniref:Diacylglycerol kinase n=1 Tax=Candidatus Portnoybacteria bacterium CG23_combo_of_CG06-09_8_20_14_all_37_13 TaxID=1974819 RepID=A0A2G9YDY6_9BACT|nr:MAG: diacylglycerol kinase [Candidatus Portnoybacteria bacterium CG23_combo_of_CG06-09_8_20_14_all_37_13]